MRQIVPGVRILVAATKNRRGRPSDSRYKEALRINTSWQLYNPEVSTRAVQNAVNAEELFCLVLETNDPSYDFFVTCEGHMKHKGIAEQIGRMMHEGMITDAQALKITHECIEKYKKGRGSKDIEKRLRKYRMDWKSGLRGEE